ncbi:hypothetical protein [Parageobacillus thermoglucosidasius]|uniref:hypothetical protein n=1 Tax=Parageobacillus thermoglucosidasius TaxID=1426 RepID=UPI001290276E|nr:hypothetical protein [Parageobacillus thermoglucosidasius]
MINADNHSASRWHLAASRRLGIFFCYLSVPFRIRKWFGPCQPKDFGLYAAVPLARTLLLQQLLLPFGERAFFINNSKGNRLFVISSPVMFILFLLVISEGSETIVSLVKTNDF